MLLASEGLASGWTKVLGGDRKQFDIFIDRMIDGFAFSKIVTDKAGKPVDYVFLEVNRAFVKMTGLKREQIIGEKATSVLQRREKEMAHLIDVYGQVALTGEPIQFENYAELLSKWFKIAAYCPEKGYFVAVYEDITERKKAEDEVWRAKNDWERTFDSVPDFVAILDNQYRIVRANRAMAHQLGVAPEKAIGLLCYECVHGLDNPPDFCPHTQTVKDGKEHTAEVHEPRLGGDFLVSTTPLKDENGNMIGSVHVARNITERKKGEEAVKQSELRFRSLYENSFDAVLLAMPDGSVLSANPAACRMFGMSEEEIKKAGRKGLVVQDARLDKAIEERERVSKAKSELTYHRKDGSTFEGEVTSSSFVDSDGINKNSLIIRDISERKKVEDSLRESEERLRLKLDSVLSPNVGIGKQELSNIIDVQALQSTMDDLYAVTKMGFALIDLKGNVLVGTGWQDICTKFHRVNPRTLQNCLESDLELSSGVKQGEIRLYKCKNNIWDIVTPLYIGKKHVANVFFGQFFFEDEIVDRNLFAEQAEKYGFNKEEYLLAFDHIPRFDREKIENLMIFYSKLAGMISKLSYSNLKS